MLVSPYSAMSLAEHLFAEQEPVVLKEDWIEENAKAIAKLGPKAWLDQLVKALTEPASLETMENPARAIMIRHDLQGEHEVIVSLEAWLTANTKLIKEIGSEEWLDRLLKLLEA